MSCLNPLIAIWSINKDGIKCPKVLGQVHSDSDIEYYRKYFGDNLIFLPCGKCVGCQKDYSRNWQTRIICEASTSISSYFITLTYASNPPAQPLKSHAREFIKGLRNKYGKGIKFFMCGEVGENTERSHYHAIIFNLQLNDLQLVAKRGLNYIYGSKEIEKIWNRGFISIGDVDVQSAGYVARYCQKKRITGKSHGEFCIMSRGLGLDYVKLNINNLLICDYIYFKGERFKLPRYFLDKYVQFSNDWQSLEAYKKRKMLRAKEFRFNKTTSMIENEARKNTREIETNRVLRKEVKNRDIS